VPSSGVRHWSRAALPAGIARLGTTLLPAPNAQTSPGNPAELPNAAPGMITRIGPVTRVQYTGTTSAKAYRSPFIPDVNTNGLSVRAASLALAHAVGTSVDRGAFLNAATAKQPVAVLGSTAAQRLA